MGKYVVIFFGLCLLASAQPAKITSLGPDGGIISCLEGSLNDAVVLAVVDERRLYRSIDGGDSWHAIALPASAFQESPEIRDIEFNPLFPDTIFLATSGGLLRSATGGTSWSYMPVSPSPRFTVRYAPGNPSIMIGSDEAGVLRSTDGGNSWMPLKDNIYFGNREVRHVAIHPADSNPSAMRIVATTGFYDTTGVFLTTNGGSTWRPMVDGLPPGEARRIFAVEIDSTGMGLTDYRVIIGTAGGLFGMQTDQAAGAWQQLKRDDIPINGSVSGGVLVYNQYDTTTQYHQFDFFVALNGSESHHMPKPHTSGNGVFKIGSRFNTIFTIIPSLLPPITHVFKRLCNISSIFVPLNSNKQKLYLATTVGVFISLDGGQTWEMKNTGFRHTEVRNLVSFFPNLLINKTLFAAVYGGGVYRSTDDGAIWSPANTGLTNPFVTAVAVDTQRNILYAGTTYTLYRSIDAGTTWTSIFTVDSSVVVQPSRFYSRSNDMTIRISPVNSDIIMFHAPAYGLHISINGGTTWSPVNTPLADEQIHVPENIAFDPSNASTIYLSGKGLFRSTDRGNSWNDISGNLPDSLFFDFAGRSMSIETISPTINSKNNQEIFIATVIDEADGFPYRVFKTTDGGGSWSGLDTALKAYDIQYDILDTKRIITSGRGGIFLSTNSGADWTIQAPALSGGTYYLLDRHTDNENIFYAGSDQGAYRVVLADVSRLTIDTVEYSFGSIQSGAESTRTIFLRNTAGTRNVIVRFAGLSDTTAYKYNGAAEYDIPAGGETSFTVTFRPAVGGFRTALIRFLTTDNVSDTLRVLLKGHAYLRSSIEKFSYDFGSVTVGNDSIMPIVVDNQFGLSSISVTYLGQTDTALFSYRGEKVFVIDTGSTVPLQFRFRPRSAGSFRSTAYFSTSDPKFPTVQLTMSGTGVVRNILDRKVLIDTGVGFAAFNGSSLRQHYGFLIRALGQTKIDVDFRPDGAASSYSAMVYVLPDGSPPREIIDSLRRYIVNGGTLVTVGDHGSRNDAPFNTMLHDSTWAEFNVRTGLRYNSDLIADHTVNDSLLAGRVIAYPHRKTFLTTNVDSVLLFNPGSISVDTTVPNAAPLLVATSPFLFSISPFDSSFNQVPSAVVAAVSRIGKGKIIAIADADIWWNGLEDDSLRRFGIFSGKNIQFALNIFGSADNFSVSLPEPTPQEAYMMISIPYSFDDSSVTALFKDLGPPNDLVWRMFGRWDEQKGYAEFPKDFKNIRRGEAYWLITKKPITVSFGNTTVQGSEEDFEIPLPPGYSMIGNPFPYTVSWANSFREDSTVERILWSYDHGFDTTSQMIDPFTGYFIKNRSDRVKKIRISSAPVDPTSALLKNDRQLPLPGADEWKIRITAESQRSVDAVNFIGVLSRSIDGIDQDDFSSPPVSPSDDLSLYFVNGKDRLSADYRSIDSDGHSWNMEVTSSASGIPFSVKLTKFNEIPKNFKIFLLDIEKERAYDITESMVYSGRFEKKEYRRHFKILIGTDEFIGSNTDGIPIIPIEFALFQNFPNPFNPRTTIRYALARSGNVRLEIFNLIGQKVKTLVHENLKTGQYSADWDGTNDRGTQVATGVYYYRLQTSHFQEVKKMTFIK